MLARPQTTGQLPEAPGTDQVPNVRAGPVPGLASAPDLTLQSMSVASQPVVSGPQSPAGTRTSAMAERLLGGTSATITGAPVEPPAGVGATVQNIAEGSANGSQQQVAGTQQSLTSITSTWKVNPGDNLEALSKEELRELLELKDRTLQLLREEVAELETSLPSMSLLEERYRRLEGLLQPPESVPADDQVKSPESLGSPLLRKIAQAVRAVEVNKIHAYHAGTYHGYPEFDDTSQDTRMPQDLVGATKYGIQLPKLGDPVLLPARKSWLYS
eukprot:TRINITY_DN66328_c0_g1_i1.p1 TRINITY_DN66328_c0_g1~~TRINITY_DN66328_c0_g1_i1.p1  ORF type:complete len:298 (+),score=66.04 TRINITY_DN66328_c0_g1_i1:81-896(+)